MFSPFAWLAFDFNQALFVETQSKISPFLRPVVPVFLLVFTSTGIAP